MAGAQTRAARVRLCAVLLGLPLWGAQAGGCRRVGSALLGARRDGGQRGRGRRNAFAKHRHADHPHVARPAGQSGVRALDRRELESRDLGVGFAPADDVVAAARVEHIAGLLPAGRLARDHVDAVHRQHHKHTRRREVAQAQRIAGARPAGNVQAPVLGMVGQHLRVVAVEHLERGELRVRPGRTGTTGQREQRSGCGAGNEQAALQCEGWTCRVHGCFQGG